MDDLGEVSIQGMATVSWPKEDSHEQEPDEQDLDKESDE